MKYEELTAVFEAQDEGGYIAYIAEIDGVNTQGETLEETKENLVDAFKLIMDYRREQINKTNNIIISPFIPMLRNTNEKIKTT